jgi:hypothetical protein
VLNNIYNENFETKISWPYKSLKLLLSTLVPAVSKKSLLQFIHTKKNQQTTTTLNAVYDSIANVSGKKFIVDSSKDPVQALAVNACQNVDAKFIWLSRDLRAITFSKLKRWKVNKRSNKKPLETLTDSFYYKKICAAAINSIKKNNALKINYEVLAANPQKELDKICGIVGLNNYAAPEFMELLDDHTIAGTPGRFERKKIAADNSWKDYFKNKALLNFLGKVFNSL